MSSQVTSSIATSADLKSRKTGVCAICGEEGSIPFLAAPDRFHGRKELYQLVRCPSCSLVWLNNPPRPTQMGEHYGADYDRSVAAAGKDPRRWRDRCDVLRRFKTTGIILDMGSSDGGFLAGLEKGSWKKYGIEMSTEVAREAEARTGAEIFVGDILDAPFPMESFDVITCFHVFEHLYQPREVLAKVSEWLKPGGLFYTLMPNIDSAGARIFKSYWYALELPRHLYHFSPASLRNLAKSVGLEEVSLITGREVFIEASIRYFVDEILQKAGISRTPLAKARSASFPRKAIRKMFRLTILPLLTALASRAGDGESIHAIFRKADVCRGAD